MEQRQTNRVAVIDLGSNTCRLVVMQAIAGYAYRLEDQIREVVRLRQGMTEAGLSREAQERAMSTLRLFARYCESAGVDVVIATATSAVREAANQVTFVERVRLETGITLRVLSGEEEAYYGVIGVLNEMQLTDGYVIDIGGGSAQLSEVRGRRFHRGHALTLGALALTERFISHDPVKSREVKALSAEIDHQLDTLKWLKPRHGYQLAGLGGTIRNLAQMQMARNATPLDSLAGMRLTRAGLDESIDLLKTLPLKKRQKLAGLNSDRADIILPGALVLEAVMKRLQLDEVAISISGLREGLFLERFWQHLPYPTIADVRRFGVLNLARSYRYQKAHVNHVRFLARRLFYQLRDLHGYGSAELQLLDAAAMLHDIGTVIGYERHHKHSQTLIEYNGLPGFSQREIALVGLLTRYHRKGKPRTRGYKALMQPGDKKLLVRLAALLRLAEFLERGRNAVIDDVMATWNDDTLHLMLVADAYPAVEMWDAERQAVPLMQTAFGRNIRLHSLASRDALDS